MIFPNFSGFSASVLRAVTENRPLMCVQRERHQGALSYFPVDCITVELEISLIYIP